MGADPDELDRIAGLLRADARSLDSIRERAAHAMTAMHGGWSGPDYARLLGQWRDVVTPQLTQAHEALTGCARTLHGQADEQRRTSGLGGTAGGGTGGTGGGGDDPVGPVGPTPGGSTSDGDGGGGDDDSPWGVTPGVSYEHDPEPDWTDHDRWTIENPDGSTTTSDTKTYVDGDGAKREWRYETTDTWHQDGTSPLQHDPSWKDHVDPSVQLWQQGGEHSANALEFGDEDGPAYVAFGSAREEHEAELKIDKNGLTLGATGTAGIYAAYASSTSKGKVGSVEYGQHTTGYVGAEATGKAEGSIGKDGAKIGAGGEAFAGGKVQTEVSASSHGVTATGGGELSYGIGAHADVDASFTTSNVGVHFDVGATLGIGGGFDVGFEVDPGEALDSVGDTAGDLWDGATGWIG
ncbi:WXG100 family type VII secretion target [Angustibacter peucedani]